MKVNCNLFVRLKMSYSASVIAPPSSVKSGCKKPRWRRPKFRTRGFKSVVHKPICDVTVTTSTSYIVYDQDWFTKRIKLEFLYTYPWSTWLPNIHSYCIIITIFIYSMVQYVLKVVTTFSCIYLFSVFTSLLFSALFWNMSFTQTFYFFKIKVLSTEKKSY